MKKFAINFTVARLAAQELQKDEGYERCPILGYSYVRAAEGAERSDFFDEWDDRLTPEDDKYAVGCYVGAILHYLGVPLKSMDDITGNFGATRFAFEREGITFTDKAFAFLDILQSLQDDGETWKNAYRLAYNIAIRNTHDHSDVFPATSDE